jgi:hypothetical protein
MGAGFVFYGRGIVTMNENNAKGIDILFVKAVCGEFNDLLC